ncbi:Uu.00g029010.m01.CDS01 [Anthostomella pinea]|uniref:Uu.00g029010.m01.CDS01 n=1 Tax=Anthostomella pinea TaxID=933095 RepID=A0AAI8V372_9PEZI|nr:Uu.00g029010.m01.CDS01 [Anthostomella pinea]
MDKDNANPTILNTSQLPTRQNRKNGSALNGPFTNSSALVHKLGYTSSPPWEISESDGTDSDAEGDMELIDEQDIYDLISNISDPEHPLSLGQLAVVNLPDIDITPSPLVAADPNTLTQVLVKITPTITHCSLATVIGLGVRVRLEKVLPPNYRVDVMIKEGTHSQDDQVNKQLADKERVAAALENDTLRGVLDKMLEKCA